jgi:hypothetical protein
VPDGQSVALAHCGSVFLVIRSGYFLNNAPRMRYRWFRSCGLFVGSGIVESGCKEVIGQRLKLSGMRWTVAGADAIATLPCKQASRPEHRIWSARHNQAPAA